MRQILFLMLLAAGTLKAQQPVAKMYDDQVTLVEHDVLSLAEAMPGVGARLDTDAKQPKPGAHLSDRCYTTAADPARSSDSRRCTPGAPRSDGLLPSGLSGRC